MRTMHVIGSRQQGGAERDFLRLTRALAASGLDVLAVTRPSSVLNAVLGAGVRHELVRMRSVFDPFARARISALARGFEARVVQTYMGRATRLTRLEPRAGAPVHVARVGGYHDPKTYRHAHAWVATTRGLREHLVGLGLPPERVYCIGNPVDAPVPCDPQRLSALRAELGLEAEARVLVCIGRLHRDRGLDVFLDAFARLPARRGDPPLRALIVGEGPQRDALREQAVRLRIDARVHWVVGPSDPQPWLDLAHVFVYPSRDAPVGSGVLEAWNHGVPVVATDTAGPAELITHGSSGLLVPREDADALAGAIVTMLDADPQVRAAMVAAGRAHIAREHDAAAVAGAYRHLYEQLAVPA